MQAAVNMYTMMIASTEVATFVREARPANVSKDVAPSFENGVPGLIALNGTSLLEQHDGVVDDLLFDILDENFA